MDKFWALIVAEVFTKREAWTPHWSYERVALVQNWDGKNKGKPRCRGNVPDGGRSVGFHQCTKPGKTQLADGSWWCATHEPKAVKARQDIQDAKWAETQERWARAAKAQKEARDIAEAFPRLVDALNQIAAGHNDPRSLAREALGELLKEPEG